LSLGSKIRIKKTGQITATTKTIGKSRAQKKKVIADSEKIIFK
jgi:hypothetical protein